MGKAFWLSITESQMCNKNLNNTVEEWEVCTRLETDTAPEWILPLSPSHSHLHGPINATWVLEDSVQRLAGPQTIL